MFIHIRCFKWNMPRYVLAQSSLVPEEETYVINIEDDEDLDERMKREADAGDFWATRWCCCFLLAPYKVLYSWPGGVKTFLLLVSTVRCSIPHTTQRYLIPYPIHQLIHYSTWLITFLAGVSFGFDQVCQLFGFYFRGIMFLAGVRGTQLTLTSGQPVDREKEQLWLKIERIQTDNYPSNWIVTVQNFIALQFWTNFVCFCSPGRQLDIFSEATNRTTCHSVVFIIS